MQPAISFGFLLPQIIRLSFRHKYCQFLAVRTAINAYISLCFSFHLFHYSASAHAHTDAIIDSDKYYIFIIYFAVRSISSPVQMLLDDAISDFAR